MSFKKMMAKSAACAGILAVTFAGAVNADNSAIAQNTPTPASDSVPDATNGTIQIHDSVKDDPGIYARDLYLAYVKGPDENANRLAERGLLALAAEAYKRTSIEPAGIVGIDIEEDDISLFPFIYWPVTEKTPRLSAEARQKVQDHTGRTGTFVIDVSGGSSIRTSDALRNLLDDMQTRPLENVKEGHVLTQSFYIIENLPGTASHDVLVERTAPEMQDSDMTSFIIGDQNWAGSWSALTVGPDIAEQSIRSGLNILFGALMGTYKLDELHQPTIKQKREFQDANEERAKQRENAADSGDTAPPATKNPSP